MDETLFDSLAKHRIIPVVEVTHVERAVDLANTLREAGLPVMEVTLRTPAALDAIRAIATELPDFAVGAGTIVTAPQLEAAVGAGAKFGVSPGFSAPLSSRASRLGLPFIPGAVTVTEVMSAHTAGHTRVKFFPAEQSGGAAVLSTLGAPLASLGVSFMPTGGIRPSNLDSYLSLPNVFAIGGTWIAPRSAIEGRDFDAIRAAATAAVKAASHFTHL